MNKELEKAHTLLGIGILFTIGGLFTIIKGTADLDTLLEKELNKPK